MLWPFGKYKGERLEDAPRGYIRWVLAELTLSDNMRKALECVLVDKPYTDWDSVESNPYIGMPDGSEWVRYLDHERNKRDR
jgi:Putative quorum-sensing-regulated virulence factor